MHHIQQPHTAPSCCNAACAASNGGSSSPTQTPCTGSLTKHGRARRHCNGAWQSRLPPLTEATAAPAQMHRSCSAPPLSNAGAEPQASIERGMIARARGENEHAVGAGRPHRIGASGLAARQLERGDRGSVPASRTFAEILPQILGSLPEVIRSWCAHHHHHHHHHHHTRSSRGRLKWSARFHRPSRRAAGPGKRHSARGTPRAQPRDVRSAGRDTWNLTGEALGGPRKRSWRRCSRARSGRRSAIRGAHSGALDRPEPSDPTARAPIRTSAPYSAADASGSSCAAGARLR